MKLTPYIKTFNTVNAYYFLDVNQNDIVPVSKTAYEFLKEAEEKGIDLSEDMPAEVAELLDAGYMAEQKVEKIVHPQTEFLGQILSRKIEKITLQLTQNCNFRCKYCHYTENVGVQRRLL